MPEPDPTAPLAAAAEPSASSRPRGASGRRRERVLELAVPVLLAALGLAGALVAWRIGNASEDAGNASQAALEAARARSAVVAQNESIVGRGFESWLDYERARRRSVGLAEDERFRDALDEAKVAAGHWFLVPSDFIEDGDLQPARLREALLAAAESEQDIDPEPHLATVASEERRISQLLGAGLVIALALPFLTFAELATARLRLAATLVGAGVLAVGLVLAGVAW
jgi:hypothetical protein